MDDSQDGWMETVHMYCIITPTGMLSFHTKPIAHVVNVLERLYVQNDETLIITPEWYCYALVDAITDEYLQITSQIEYGVEAVDELSMLLDDKEREEMLSRITMARKQVTVAQRHLFAKPDVLRALVKRISGGKQAEEVALYLGDVLDHAMSASQQIASCDATLRRAHSNYLAHLSVHMAAASSRLSNLMGKWTVFGSILIPLTIVAGFFGMNVYVPGKDPGDGSMDLTWWWGIMGGSATYVLGVLTLAKLKNIL
jgi:magnesium transporter